MLLENEAKSLVHIYLMSSYFSYRWLGLVNLQQSTYFPEMGYVVVETETKNVASIVWSSWITQHTKLDINISPKNLNPEHIYSMWYLYPIKKPDWSTHTCVCYH